VLVFSAGLWRAPLASKPIARLCAVSNYRPDRLRSFASASILIKISFAPPNSIYENN